MKTKLDLIQQAELTLTYFILILLHFLETND